MRKELLHSALNHPELLTAEQLSELRETVERYPFFGAAQIALSQAYRDSGDHRFSDQLSSAAIYSSNRTSLYRRYKTTVSEDSAQHHPPTAPTPVIHEDVSARLAAAIVDQEEAPVAEFVHPEIKTEPLKPTPVQFTSPTEIPAPQETTSIRIESLETLDAQILVDAVSKSIELEVQPESSTEETTLSNSVTDLTPDDETSYAALIYRRAQRLQGTFEDVQEEASIEANDRETDDTLPAFQSTPLSHGIQRIRTAGPRDHQKELIERFIRTEPQIARGKAGEYPTGNLAKDSLEEDFSFVTETMAVLFAKQGKLDKARKAFRKLMEQHPEKSIYFAAQLKNLEQFKK